MMQLLGGSRHRSVGFKAASLRKPHVTVSGLRAGAAIQCVAAPAAMLGMLGKSSGKIVADALRLPLDIRRSGVVSKKMGKEGVIFMGNWEA